MLKIIKGHDCLCLSCSPEFHDSMLESADANAQEIYKRQVSAEVRRSLFEAATEKYREDIE